jgi:hypothetical protein
MKNLLTVLFVTMVFLITDFLTILKIRLSVSNQYAINAGVFL